MNKKLIPGLLLCLGVALPSYFLGKLVPVVGGPVFAIILGMIVTCRIKDKSGVSKGIAFTSKKILQYAVILLGFGMNISDILQKGIQSLPVILSTITVALTVAYLFTRILGIDRTTGTLIGVGSSICGGSAIAAASAVINADDNKVAASISVIFLFNVAAALIFPLLGQFLGLTNEGFALFAGTAVNDTSSVTAAASTWDALHPGADTLSEAAIVKLTRTLAIIPISLALAFMQMKKKKGEGGSFSMAKVFPFFITWFLAASLITTFFDIPAEILGCLKFLSKFFIIMAMGAIGLNTDFAKLVSHGRKPVLLGFVCWISICVSSLAVQYVCGMW